MVLTDVPSSPLRNTEKRSSRSRSFSGRASGSYISLQRRAIQQAESPGKPTDLWRGGSLNKFFVCLLPFIFLEKRCELTFFSSFKVVELVWYPLHLLRNSNSHPARGGGRGGGGRKTGQRASSQRGTKL